ncbi:hypothetical protein QA601_04140 [Chitinispirillales bacterium ANBcel5]|uniref:hypothetical protein n=1 Tax=Cellulosispirillum alkaliphilum TaxID=3039283 RepID=UPI002A4ED6A0|nr:hypothetical protein [Chitinispirillales bacterium ANBcel5]
MGLQRIHSLFPRRTINVTDTSFSIPESTVTLSESDVYEGIEVSGFKSFGVSVGSFGEVSLEQGLDISAGGEIQPGTQLRAHLTDQGSSMEGSTREISDFDMIYVSLTNPLFNITLGDQFARWPFEGILSGNKKIKGLSASYTPSFGTVSAFGSLSEGRRTVQTIRGRSGTQGPYYLTGRGEPGIISPVDGTVRVQMNGKVLEEGRDNHFVVDYDFGTITFTPRVLIRDDAIIRVEYEYKTYDYRRSLLGGDVGFFNSDSSLALRGVLWTESDNKNHPVDLVLSDDHKELLKDAGDQKIYAPVAIPVSPLEFSERSSMFPLYRKQKDTLTGEDIFIHVPQNPPPPDSIRTFYEVYFSRATGDNTGSYEIDTTRRHPNQDIYRYVGSGKGEYTPYSPVPAPIRETAGELEMAYSSPNLNININLAGKEHNRNLFSDIDNDNNLSSAAKVNFSAGNLTRENPSVSLDGSYYFRSRNFSDELLSAHDRRQRWGEESTENEDMVQNQYWESNIGFSPFSSLIFRIGAGQSFRDSLRETEKIQSNTDLYFFEERLGLNHTATVFRHHLSHTHLTHRQNSRISLRLNTMDLSLIHRDEWFLDTLSAGRGKVTGGAEFTFHPLNLTQRFEYSQFRKGEMFPGVVDTGYSVGWDQSFSHSPVDGWSLTGESRWHRVKHHGQSSSSTLLLYLLSEVQPQQSGFSSRQEFRSNQEQASLFIQVPVYAGRGLGTHVYDSLRNEYVPRKAGDYQMREMEVYDRVSEQRIRKSTFNADWYFSPQRPVDGILGDLSYQGVVTLEEHVDAANSSLKSRFPGILSLSSNRNNRWDDDVQYAFLSYRQDVNWNPNIAYRANLYLLTSLRQLRSYREKTVEPGLSAQRRFNSLTLDANAKYVRINREDSSGYFRSNNNFEIHDVSLELIQRQRLGHDFEIYLRENLGFAYKSQRYSSAPKISDNLYFQIRPGISWRSGGRGFAEFSYTFSRVPQSGDLDYRMAGGFSSGTSHVFSLFADVQTGNNFSVGGSYRGEVNKPYGSSTYGDFTHIFSIQARAFF